LVPLGAALGDVARLRAAQREAGVARVSNPPEHDGDPLAPRPGSKLMKVDGACHCGFITIEAEADPEQTTICHCTDCQIGTGSAFRVYVPASGASFRVSGQPTSYLKTTAESRRPRLQALCPRRGSPVYSTTPGEGRQASYMLRVGTLRQRKEFVPKQQNWFRSAQPWVTSLGSIQRNEKQG